MDTTRHRLTGVALITGSASGIGRAVAHGFVADGCTRLILADINEAGLAAVAEELQAMGPEIRTCTVVCDTSNEADVQRMVDRGVEAFGAIHYAVNNAGVTNKPRAPTHELELDAFDRVQNINLRGVWLCERAELRQMLKQQPDIVLRSGPPQRGSIINISSIFGRVAHFSASAYCATKSGILGLSRSDACAYGREGIRVNSVCPGWIRTPLVDYGIKMGTYDENVVRRIPMERWGDPEDIADAVTFLASTRASFITGEEIVVDGGSIVQSVS
ncbi:hypothetical protein FE257_012407 [Aspergillus nanangensis]|uniref:Ketoreductase domain-containing protein n=1 Tax=Aspergillus nanangensis TaxID=2582783 RepID=A0AAD4CUK7_ASPNN|nr:hypothetical protein FE257_012407 [Aspergillus nanangensis]